MSHKAGKRAKRGKRPPGPGYAAKVLVGAEAGLAAGTIRRGALTVAEVRHDDGCALLDGRGDCTCDPDVKFVPFDPMPCN